jgi:hypothetical protein
LDTVSPPSLPYRIVSPARVPVPILVPVIFWFLSTPEFLHDFSLEEYLCHLVIHLHAGYNWKTILFKRIIGTQGSSNSGACLQVQLQITRELVELGSALHKTQHDSSTQSSLNKPRNGQAAGRVESTHSYLGKWTLVTGYMVLCNQLHKDTSHLSFFMPHLPHPLSLDELT